MTIEIENLHFDAILGILDKERVTPQKVIVNCIFTYDYSADKFIDYAKVCSYLEIQLKEQKFYLIEDALEFFIENIKHKFSAITYLKLKISKPQILPNCTVSAHLEKNY